MTRTVEELVNYFADDCNLGFTGSAVICQPPVLDTDIDYVVIYCGRLSAALQADGFVISDHTEYPNDNIKACYRRGTENVIAVADKHTFELWTKATQLAYQLNLREKSQRVKLFQFITEGVVRGTEIRY